MIRVVCCMFNILTMLCNNKCRVYLRLQTSVCIHTLCITVAYLSVKERPLFSSAVCLDESVVKKMHSFLFAVGWCLLCLNDCLVKLL